MYRAQQPEHHDVGMRSLSHDANELDGVEHSGIDQSSLHDERRLRERSERVASFTDDEKLSSTRSTEEKSHLTCHSGFQRSVRSFSIPVVVYIVLNRWSVFVGKRTRCLLVAVGESERSSHKSKRMRM